MTMFGFGALAARPACGEGVPVATRSGWELRFNAEHLSPRTGAAGGRSRVRWRQCEQHGGYQGCVSGPLSPHSDPSGPSGCPAPSSLVRQARANLPRMVSTSRASDATAPVQAAQPQTADVCVVGGGGHVGLPLSWRSPRRACGWASTTSNEATVDTHRAARCRSSRPARTSCWRGPAHRAPDADSDAQVLRGAQGDRRHRHAHRRVPEPVDDGFRACHGPDRAVHRRWRARGHAPAPSIPARPSASPGCSRSAASSGRRVLPGAHRRGPCARGARAPCRRSSARTTSAAGRRGPTSCSAARRRRPCATTTQRGRAGQALHQRVALHEVRDREPVLHDRRPGGRRLQRDPARHPRTTTRAPRICPGRASPPARACSRTRCSWPRSRPTTSRSASRRCRSTRACRRTSSDAMEERYGEPRRPEGGHPGHGIQGRVRRHARVAQLQAAQAARLGRRRGAVHRSVRRRTTACCRSSRCLGDSDILVLGAPHRAYRALRRRAAATWSTCGDALRRGDPTRDLREGPRHRRGRLHLRLPRRRAADARPRGGRASTTSRSTAAWRRATTTTRSYRFVEGDAKDVDAADRAGGGVDQVVAAAAMIGGISYFHEFAYDLLAENERILAATFDAAIAAHRDGQRWSGSSCCRAPWSSRSTDVFPTPEGAQLTRPPPMLTYGFQKLASEYFAKGAHEQYGLPYTILRPFNCVGIGERRALRDTDVMSGNVKLALSHVVPDLVDKGAQGPGPAAHPRRRHAGAPLHLRRRPGAGHPHGDGVAARRSTTTSTCRPRERRPCASWPRRSGARSTASGRSASSTTSPSSMTCSAACPTSRRRSGCSASRPRRRSTRCSTR